MCNRMVTVWSVIREHMAHAQDAQQHVISRNAQPGEFHSRERVLMLILTKESKLLATWLGPYEVIEKVGK